MNKTSIIILSYNTLEYTKLCIESIRKYTKSLMYEIIVVDNASVDGSVDWLKAQRDLICIFNDENQGFPKGCNQGIAVSSGSEILLLNSDTVVSKYWLENLIIALYSSEKTGAVGCVTNSCSNFQAIEVSYKSLSEMYSFAEQYNKSNPKSWEKRLKLVGFCFLIKRSVVEKIGGLDERFSPGNYEDDDYSLRIIEAGYELVLCKDTFIHHFGSTSFKQSFGEVELKEKQKKYNQILIANSEKFKEKWGFSGGYEQSHHKDLIELLVSSNETYESILVIGCGCGADLLALKKLYPNAHIQGISTDESTTAIAQQITDVEFCEDIETGLFDVLRGKYNLVILGECIEELKKPKEFLRKTTNFLEADAVLLAKIHNSMYWRVLQDLLLGQSYNFNSKNAEGLIRSFYTLEDVKNIFLTNMPYENLSIVSGIENIQLDHNFIKKMQSLGGENRKNELATAVWIVSVHRKKEENNIFNKNEAEGIRLMTNLLNGLEEKTFTDRDCAQIWSVYDETNISLAIFVMLINKNISKAAEAIVLLAIFAYQLGQREKSLQILIEFYKNNDEAENIIYTLASLLELEKEHESAWSVIKNYHGKSKDVLELQNKLRAAYQRQNKGD